MKTTQTASYLWLFWMLTVCGLMLDLGSKYIIFAALYNNGAGGEYPLIPEAFRLTADFTSVTDPGDFLSPLRTIGGDQLPRVNQGALFGMGQGQNHVFTFISLLAAIGIIYWSSRPATTKDRFLSTALGLILAGTLGNLFDRVVFGGVRDFLHWFYVIDWPVFNIADCCLVVGACLLLFQAMFLTQPQEKPTTAEAQEELAAHRES